MRSRTEYLLL